MLTPIPTATATLPISLSDCHYQNKANAARSTRYTKKWTTPLTFIRLLNRLFDTSHFHSDYLHKQTAQSFSSHLPLWR
jgi:hypothetical protein